MATPYHSDVPLSRHLHNFKTIPPEMTHAKEFCCRCFRIDRMVP